MRVGRIKATLFHGERPVLAQRHYKKHQRMFAKLKDTVMFEYGEEVSLDFYNAVMMMCFEVVDTVRGEKQYVDDWCRVAAMMETVYAHMEGLGENDGYITDGVNMKHKIERILEAA